MIKNIYFFCPDHISPSAGIKRLYHHVKILSEAGFSAFILHTAQGFHLTWHGYDVDVHYLSKGVMIEENDVLVIPESQPDLMEQTRHLPCQRVVFAQSWAYIYQYLREFHNWKDFNISHVITPSRVIKDFIEWGMNLTTSQLTVSVNTLLYRYSGLKTMQVAYLKKKDTAAELIEKVLKSKHIDLRNIEWVGIKGLSEVQYAQHLMNSHVFLSTSTIEGDPMACLEAMACGCLVIGYTGIGGREFMIGQGERQNCFIAENGDYLSLARMVEQVFNGIRKKDPKIERIRENAVTFASGLTVEKEIKSVLDFWKQYSATIQKAGTRKPVLLHTHRDDGLFHESPVQPNRYPKNIVDSQSKPKAFDCSIVIPVFNQVDFTKQCLTALVENTDGPDYEVIIVDNGSADETPVLLNHLEGDVKTIRNPENLGFAVACNQGASAAAGRYLVFLNNDTIPQKGWLREMMQIANDDPSIGIVGSKLIFPKNGKIQHAGVVISKKNKTPYNLYQNFPSDHPAVNRLRDFMAVTGACLLIRRSLFHEVGGFDQDYVNCFEDVDLCLKVREKGFRVVYNPASVLYHYEGMTEGRKRHVDASTSVFVSKWWDKIEPDEDIYYQEDGFRIIYSSDREARVISL